MTGLCTSCEPVRMASPARSPELNLDYDAQVRRNDEEDGASMMEVEGLQEIPEPSLDSW